MSQTNPPKASTNAVTFVAALLLLLYAVQCFHSRLGKSATYDEQVYVLAGYSFLETGEYELKKDAPPLVPFLSAVAIKLFSDQPPIISDEIREQIPVIKKYWLEGNFECRQEYPLAQSFFAENDGPKLIQIARIPCILIGVLLGIYIFRFGQIMFGDWAGLAALACFALDPNLIGHGRVVAADMGLACFFLMAHYYLYRCLTERSAWNVIPFSISVSLCISVKLSGLLVCPCLLALSLIVLVARPTSFCHKLEMDRKSYAKSKWILASLALVSAGLFTVFLVCLLYCSTDGISRYVHATSVIYANVQRPYTSYLLGEFQERFWYYYFVAIVVKVPAATLLLAGSGFLTIRSSAVGWVKLMFCLVPIILVMLVCTQDGINIGLRRVLVVYPFLLLLVSALFHWMNSEADNLVMKRIGKVLGALLIGWLAWTAVQVYPNHLSSFNLISGSSKNGHKYLAESNLSWGQSLPALGRYMRENNVDRVQLNYYGFDTPEDYGVQFDQVIDHEIYWPIQAVYAMSAHKIIVKSAQKDPGSNWFERFQPTTILDDSIYVYDLRNYPDLENNRTPEQCLSIARNLRKQNKHSASVTNYQAYLRFNPTNAKVHDELAQAAAEFGHQALEEHHRLLMAKYYVLQTTDEDEAEN